MNKVQNGFTLIELMIVVAIIGILASMAIPAYQSYAIRAQVAEGLNLSGAVKMAVATYYLDYGSYPTDNNEASLEPAAGYQGNYVSSISVNGAVVSIQYGNDAHSAISGQTVELTASNNLGSINWSCASGGVISDFHLPTACR